MYIVGDLDTLESRMHQLATTLVALQEYIDECNEEYHKVTIHVQNKWEREARQCKFRITQNGADLLIQLLHLTPPCHYETGPIEDEDGNSLLDEEGYVLFGEAWSPLLSEAGMVLLDEAGDELEPEDDSPILDEQQRYLLDEENSFLLY